MRTQLTDRTWLLGVQHPAPARNMVRMYIESRVLRPDSETVLLNAPSPTSSNGKSRSRKRQVCFPGGFNFHTWPTLQLSFGPDNGILLPSNGLWSTCSFSAVYSVQPRWPVRSPSSNGSGVVCKVGYLDVLPLLVQFSCWVLCEILNKLQMPFRQSPHPSVGVLIALRICAV